MNALGRAKRQPNRRELFWLRKALLASLEEGHSPEGEDAMDKAERSIPIPEHAASDLASNVAMTVMELRGLLDGIIVGDG